MAFAIVILLLNLACFAHASSRSQVPPSAQASARAVYMDGGFVQQPLSIAPNTPIKLRTADGQVLESTAGIVSRSSVITAFMNDISPASTSEVPLPPKTRANAMAHVLAWLDHHQGAVFPYDKQFDPRKCGRPEPAVLVPDWDRRFIGALDGMVLLDVMSAAYELKLFPLYQLGKVHMRNLIKGKTSWKEIGETFGFQTEL